MQQTNILHAIINHALYKLIIMIIYYFNFRSKWLKIFRWINLFSEDISFI